MLKKEETVVQEASEIRRRLEADLAEVSLQLSQAVAERDTLRQMMEATAQPLKTAAADHSADTPCAEPPGNSQTPPHETRVPVTAGLDTAALQAAQESARVATERFNKLQEAYRSLEVHRDMLQVAGRQLRSKAQRVSAGKSGAEGCAECPCLEGTQRQSARGAEGRVVCGGRMLS